MSANETAAILVERAPAPPRLYTLAEVAEIARSTTTTVRRMIHAGELEAVRWGVELRIPHAALLRYLESHVASGPATVRDPRRRGRRPAK